MLSKLLIIRICRCRFVLTFRWSELFPKEWRPARNAASQQHNNVLVEFSTKIASAGNVILLVKPRLVRLQRRPMLHWPGIERLEIV
jgi:hypothetical protein